MNTSTGAPLPGFDALRAKAAGRKHIQHFAGMVAVGHVDLAGQALADGL